MLGRKRLRTQPHQEIPTKQLKGGLCEIWKTKKAARMRCHVGHSYINTLMHTTTGTNKRTDKVRGHFAAKTLVDINSAHLLVHRPDLRRLCPRFRFRRRPFAAQWSGSRCATGRGQAGQSSRTVAWRGAVHPSRARGGARPAGDRRRRVRPTGWKRRGRGRSSSRCGPLWFCWVLKCRSNCRNEVNELRYNKDPALS